MRLAPLQILVALFMFAPAAVHSATPPSGTLSVATPTLTYTYGPNVVSNPSAQAVDGGICSPPAQPCDHYDLTIDLPSDFATTNGNATIRISTAWNLPADDYDIYLLSPTGTFENQAAGSDNPEVMNMPAGAGTSSHRIRILPFAVAGSTATTTITLTVPPPPPPDADGDGVADADDRCPGTPLGTSVDATGCDLPAGDPLTCDAPGLTMLTDTTASLSEAPGTDLKSLQMYQPAQVPMGDRIQDQLLAFRINVDAGGTPPTPATSWFASFESPVGFKGVRMTGDNAGNPVFHSYSVGANSGTPPVQDGRFVEGAKAADPASSYNRTTGTITILVKATDLGLTAPGQELKKLNSGVTQTTGGVATAVDDGMPEDNLARSTVKYVLHDNTVCGRPKLKPVGPPPPALGLAPRYQIHVAQPGLGNSAGEPTVGYNPLTKRAMFIAYTQALRVTFQENRPAPADPLNDTLPMSCDATWEDKSGLLTTANSLDPLMYTDQATGRTFNSQLSGANSLFEYSDDDGENWTPGQAGPPNGGADHQGMISGPYPAGLRPPSATFPNAFYYCSQSVGTAFCARSDDGAQTIGPGFTFKNTDCGAGALHGHPKVAPDGTLYIPDSSQCVLSLGDSAERVVAFVSEDAGVTYAVRPLPNSSGGGSSDPSIGIATDGSLYMCYENADGRARMAVSHDKGLTWLNDTDIGAAAGLVATRFPAASAGDRMRGACAFLGTTTSGASASLDFEGVWHGFIATTYDGGQSYHLVNVTPNDPIQGYGGVGPDGTNRNLLDFNDLEIDEFGRVYFAYADGCVGACVRDPSANGFADKASLVRQTGGRTLFAAYDNVDLTQFNVTVPLKPAPACARQDISVRTDTQAKVIWNAPDTGGSAITNYKLYRALAAAGPYVFLADTGDKTTYTDRTVDPLVEKYFYKVVAENVVGLALDSNIIELVVTILPFVDTCSAPGDLVITDAVGDSSPPADDTDIVFVGVSEPADLPDDFVFTYKVVNFTSGVPPTAAFYGVLFPARSNFYIGMNAVNPNAPSFEYGTFTVDTVTTFAKEGNLSATSGYAPDGTISLVVPRALLGNPAIDDVIPGFEARARIGANTTSRDTTSTADYVVRGSAICDPAAIVLASLTAPTDRGAAPLSVRFTLTGTPGAGNTLDTYSILFGDEAGADPTPVTGSFNGASSVQVSHTYSSAGTYRATLTVKDTAGTASGNLAEKTIVVTPQGSSSPGVGNNKLGGSLPPLSLLILVAAGMLGRRLRQHSA